MANTILRALGSIRKITGIESGRPALRTGFKNKTVTKRIKGAERKAGIKGNKGNWRKYL